MIIVLDTDVVVAGFRSKKGKSRQILTAILNNKFKIALSVPLVLQYEEVLTRPEHLKAIGASKKEVLKVLDALCGICVPIQISFLWRPILKDADDEMVLETAIHAESEALVTFNIKDFSAADKFNVKILRPAEFWQEIGENYDTD